MITIAILTVLVKQAGEKHEVDLQPQEINFFLSGFITTFGIEAVEIARKSEEKRCDTLRFPTGKFDLTTSRLQFVRQLCACTGLGDETCEAMLSAIEALVQTELAQKSPFQFERLGVIERAEGEGFVLNLSNNLAIARGKRTK